ncbi:MAG: glycosyltransferase, partial [Acidobacteria bacterium]|nr:glycosyltransferase [Acidobacteriota bacterium]
MAGVSWLTHWSLASEPLPFEAVLGVALVVGVGVTAAFERWNPAGHAAFTAVLISTATFLVYACYVIAAAQLGPWSLAFALLLLGLQVATLALLMAHTFEIIDVVCRTRWQRVGSPKIAPGYTPKVSLHVPTHNEPPELVIETLEALARLDYPNYEVLVIDNNTADESLWRPVEAHCRRQGPRFRFFHLMPWPGYKSGALNFALQQTAPDAEIVGVVDADYLVEPNFLKDLVGHFAEPRVAFVQTPQDYRDAVERGRYGRALYLAYEYFFKVSMASRNEQNAIIFGGTMGLIRRSALEQVGGWDEWCITEDAEVSLRLLDAGYEGSYVDHSYGRGLMPLDYAGLKKQRFRWAFGGMQLLRMHARKLLFGAGGKLNPAQRFAYLSGGLQWLNDPMALAFTALLLMGSGALLVGGSFYLQPLVGAVMLMPPLFILFAVLRFLWAFRVRARCTWREAFDALQILLGLTWVVSLACVRGLFSKQGVFLRTPKKKSDEPTMGDAVRVVLSELAIGTACFAAAVAVALSASIDLFSARGVLFLLLFWQAAIYWTAVRSSLWNWAESRMPLPVMWRRTFRTLGHTWGRLIPERRTVAWLSISSALVFLLFYISVINAPVGERLMRADPLAQLLPARTLLSPSPEEQAGAVLVREGDAARRGDVASALALWHPDGIIVDVNFSPSVEADNRVWRGPAELRQRYLEEFRQRRYRQLQHNNLRI